MGGEDWRGLLNEAAFAASTLRVALVSDHQKCTQTLSASLLAMAGTMVRFPVRYTYMHHVHR